MIRPARWLARVVGRTVPSEWRDAIATDLDDESNGHRAGSWWAAAATVAIAVQWHLTFTRSAVMSDIRYAIRSLVRAPGFALGAIVTFALGIGVNVAVFSAVDRMLFRPLPFADPARLVVLGQYPVGGTQPYGTVPASLVVATRKLPGIADLCISEWNDDSYRQTANPDGAKYLAFVPVSYTTLRTLGIRPIIGTDFTERDARTKARRILLNYATWQRDFGGRADVIGRLLWGLTPGTRAEIVGVLPADLISPQVVSFSLTWNGLSVTDDTLDAAGANDRSTPPVLRLGSGVSMTVAQAQIDVIAASLPELRPAPGRGAGPRSELRIVSLREALFGRYETYLLLVFAAATLVLLVGCANLASLLLVRARSREHRAAMQIALGASRARVVRSAVVEALLLATAGSALALLVLRLADHAIAAWLPPIFSTYAAPVFAGRVMVFSALLATLSAVVAGALPGWRSSRVDVLAILQRGGDRVGSGRLRGSAGVLAFEVAVSMVLVACAVLAARCLIGLVTTDVGFNRDNLLTLSAFIGPSTDPVALEHRYADELEALRTMPDVEAATGADVLPIIGAVAYPMWTGLDSRLGQRWSITDDFVRTMGLRVVAGRDLSRDEVRSQAAVGLLSESGVKLVWPGVMPQDAVGRLLQFPGEAPRQVIGVVSDVRGTFDQVPFPSLYVPIGSNNFRGMMFAVRVAPGRTLTPIEAASYLRSRGFAPNRVSITVVAQRLSGSVVNQQFRAELFGGFGLTALILAMVGLYAVQSFHVAARRTEFGVRLSLGAEPRDLSRLLIAQTLGPAAVGVVLGAIGTFWLARFLQALLEGVDARSPMTYASVGVALLVASVAAVWLPARRAARTDPAIVLRAQ